MLGVAFSVNTSALASKGRSTLRVQNGHAQPTLRPVPIPRMLFAGAGSSRLRSRAAPRKARHCSSSSAESRAWHSHTDWTNAVFIVLDRVW